MRPNKPGSKRKRTKATTNTITSYFTKASPSMMSSAPPNRSDSDAMPPVTPMGCQEADSDAMPPVTPMGCQEADSDAMPPVTPMGCQEADSDAMPPVTPMGCQEADSDAMPPVTPMGCQEADSDAMPPVTPMGCQEADSDAMPPVTPMGCQEADSDAMPPVTPMGCQEADSDAMPPVTPMGCQEADSDAMTPVDHKELDTTPEQPSEYQELNPNCHLPACWNDAKYEEFRAKYPWLVAHEGGLLCNICSKVKKLHCGVVMTHGVYLGPEWLSVAVFPNGDTKKAQLASLRNKIKRHKTSVSHQKAETCLEKTNKHEIASAFTISESHHSSVTEKVFRTVYYLVKQNRPFADHVNLCELQMLNGVDLGFGLHSRYSATEILSSIASNMWSELCSAIISDNCKISLILMNYESTTVSHKSALILYIRTFMYSETKSTDAFAFPLELIELESLSAESITNNVLSTLDKHTFTEAYLKKNLVGVCADGASTMVGKKSGVMTRFFFDFLIFFYIHSRGS
uniref:E3 SUMO-protein ligase KIAA1586-like n=1 Tax=Myxine glutinosa TaxID=7769 RepID=UPI00358E052F